MTKYVIYIDYRANETTKFEYCTMEAKNFKEAINEAEKLYNPKSMYLIRIMEREGKSFIDDGNPATCKSQLYKAVECKRSCEGGWHSNTTENSEEEHIVKYNRLKERSGATYEWFDLVK